MLKLEQFSVGNYTFPKHSFKYYLDTMNELGVKTIELWLASPHLYWEDYTEAQFKQIASEIRERGLKVCCITPEQCMYPINVGSSNPAERRRSIDVFKKAADLACIFDAEKALVTSGHHEYDASAEDCWKYSVDSYRELAEYAKSIGKLFVLEPLTKKGLDVVVTADEEKRMLEDVNDFDGIKGMIDTDESARSNEYPKDFIDALGMDHFAHCHIVDGLPGGHLALGDGVIDMGRCFQELEDAGYDGPMTLEVMNARYNQDPKAAIKQSFDYYKNWLANH